MRYRGARLNVPWFCPTKIERIVWLSHFKAIFIIVYHRIGSAKIGINKRVEPLSVALLTTVSVLMHFFWQHVLPFETTVPYTHSTPVSQPLPPSLPPFSRSVACHPPIELSENSYRNSSTIAPLSLSLSLFSPPPLHTPSFLPSFLSPLPSDRFRCPQRQKYSALSLNTNLFLCTVKPAE